MYCHSEPKSFLQPMPAVPPDIGYSHVALWRIRQKNAAHMEAFEKVGAEIRSGAWSPLTRLTPPPYQPAPRIDDADFMDGDLDMYRTDPEHEGGL